MAKKNAGSRKSGSFGVDFLSVYLSADDKRQLAEATPTADDLMEGIVRVVEGGHKLSFSWSESNQSAICTITSPPDGNGGNKIAVSSFGSLVENALMSALYKFDVLAQGGDWSLVEGRQDYDDFA